MPPLFGLFGSRPGQSRDTIGRHIERRRILYNHLVEAKETESSFEDFTTRMHDFFITTDKDTLATAKNRE